MKTPFVITHLFDTNTIRIKMDLIAENDFLIDAMTALGYMVDNPLNTQWFDIPVPEEMVEVLGFIRDEESLTEAIHGYVKKFFADLRRDCEEEFMFPEDSLLGQLERLTSDDRLDVECVCGLDQDEDDIIVDQFTYDQLADVRAGEVIHVDEQPYLVVGRVD